MIYYKWSATGIPLIFYFSHTGQTIELTNNYSLPEQTQKLTTSGFARISIYSVRTKSQESIQQAELELQGDHDTFGM